MAEELIAAEPLLRILLFVLGGVLAHLTLSRTSRMSRLPFVASMIGMFILFSVAMAIIDMNSHAGVLHEPFAGFVFANLAIYGLWGYALWAFTSARSRDATGKNGWAIRCFIPIIQFAALPYLAFKGSKGIDYGEIFGDDENRSSTGSVSRSPVASHRRKLVTDGDWSSFDGEVFRVTNFTPMAEVVEGKIIAAKWPNPYAMVTLEAPHHPETLGLIWHKMDFQNLWTVFVDRGLSVGEELNIAWTKSSLRWPAKLLSRFMPGLAVMICKAGFNERLHNQNRLPDLSGDASWEDDLPLVYFVPDVLK